MRRHWRQRPGTEVVCNVDEEDDGRYEHRDQAPPAEKQRNQRIFAKIFSHAVSTKFAADPFMEEHHHGADVLNEHHLPCRSLMSARMTVCVHDPSNGACDPGDSASALRLRDRLAGPTD